MGAFNDTALLTHHNVTEEQRDKNKKDGKQKSQTSTQDQLPNIINQDWTLFETLAGSSNEKISTFSTTCLAISGALISLLTTLSIAILLNMNENVW